MTDDKWQESWDRMEEKERRDIGELETIICIFCCSNAGDDYHLLEDSNVSCDDCWDERLRS